LQRKKCKTTATTTILPCPKTTLFTLSPAWTDLCLHPAFVWQGHAFSFSLCFFSLSLSLCILSLFDLLQADESMMISSRLHSDNHLFVLSIVQLQFVCGAAQRAAWHVEWHLETNSLAWHSETNSLSLSLCILSLSLQTDESMMISSRLRSVICLFSSLNSNLFVARSMAGGVAFRNKQPSVAFRN
jgi:hypothetical protein